MRHDRHRRRRARRGSPRYWFDDTCDLCPWQALPGERLCSWCFDRDERRRADDEEDASKNADDDDEDGRPAWPQHTAVGLCGCVFCAGVRAANEAARGTVITSVTWE